MLDRAPLLTIREYTMMDLMNRLTDKRKWAEKIYHEGIVAKLKEDILAAPNVDISEKMVDWVGFHVGVMVSQISNLYQICVFKSSTPSLI